MNGQFEITFVKQTANIPMRRTHYHEHYEIYYLFAGERNFYVEDRIFHLKKGSMIFIKKHDIHKTLEGGELHERALIYFIDAFLEQYRSSHLTMLLSSFSQDRRVIDFNNLEQNYIENILFQMNNEYSNPNRPGQVLYFESLLVQLLLFASRKLTETVKTVYTPMNKKIAEVIEYCNSNYSKALTLKDVSSRFFISSFHFSRLFKRYTGFNFTEYILTLRIREAQRLLRETSGKVIDIAQSVGYMNITHFNRKFKQISKMAPLEYRKMIRANERK
ncbi:helix-turn-helix transcriptional regulator [Paenibacillus harenae]|uniref:helix-turn-helix transcriptional regulator n=1 Tax=Paenibacillus harenae TaxID=306543 RepID=UPI00040470A9|nr:AraC family transcriptional regulator [Paenibacillus harenae]